MTPELFDQEAVFISKADREVEVAVYKRDFTAEQRKKLASEGKALSDGSYPIETAADLGPAATLARSKHGNYRAAEALIAKRARELGVANPLESKTEKSELEFGSELIVKSEEERLAYTVVLEPELEDSQGDIIGADVIEKAAHRWLAEYRQHDLEHDGEIKKSIVPVESYCAPCDLTIDTPAGPQPVRKGAWVVGMKVLDDEAWQGVKEGKYTGSSIAGSGVRTAIEV